MNPLVGIFGVSGAGKDTFGQLLVQGHGFKRIAFADPLRDVAYAADPFVKVQRPSADSRYERLSAVIDEIGWAEAKKYDDVRRFLQRLATEGVRDHLDQDIWLNAAMSRVEGPTVFTDMRFQNEHAAILARGGVTVRIERPGYAPALGHQSDTDLDLFHFDVMVYNDGKIEELVDQAFHVAKVANQVVKGPTRRYRCDG